MGKEVAEVKKILRQQMRQALAELSQQGKVTVGTLRSSGASRRRPGRTGN